MTFIFLLTVMFGALLILAYLEDPKTEYRRNLDRLVKESLKKEYARQHNAKRCYRYMNEDWVKRRQRRTS